LFSHPFLFASKLCYRSQRITVELFEQVRVEYNEPLATELVQ